MKIALIGSYPLSTDCIHGGVESSVYGLAKALSVEHEVHVLDMPRPKIAKDSSQDGNIHVHRFINAYGKQLLSLMSVRDMVSTINDINPDVCHIHGSNPVSYMLYKKLKKNNHRVLITIHGLSYIEHKNIYQSKPTLKNWFKYRLYSCFEFKLLQSVPVAIVDTGYVLEALKTYPTKRLPELHIIPQGVDDVFYSLPKDQHDSSRLLSVGTISPRKGHLYTVQSFEQLRESGVCATLSIVGSIADTTYYNEVKSHIEQSKYARDIALITNCPQQKLLELYTQSGVFVLHSQEESQGIALCEAMACGLPIVSTRVGGIPWVVKEWRTGFLTTYENVEDFSSCIAKAIDKEQWLKFSNEAVSESEQYHWRNIAENVLNLYRSERI